MWFLISILQKDYAHVPLQFIKPFNSINVGIPLQKDCADVTIEIRLTAFYFIKLLLIVFIMVTIFWDQSISLISHVCSLPLYIGIYYVNSFKPASTYVFLSFRPGACTSKHDQWLSGEVTSQSWFTSYWGVSFWHLMLGT